MSDLEVMHTASENGIFECQLIEFFIVVRRIVFLS
jgi:hypothetical protein